MTKDGRLGPAGYGGQLLVINLAPDPVASFRRVLENDSGYDVAYMLNVITNLEAICRV